MLKHAENHRCEVNILGALACKGIHFRKSLTESERSENMLAMQSILQNICSSFVHPLWTFGSVNDLSKSVHYYYCSS